MYFNEIFFKIPNIELSSKSFNTQIPDLDCLHISASLRLDPSKKVSQLHADTLPLSLESNAEISKEGKVAERSEDLIVDAHSDKEDARPKRVTKKPTYLKDYV